MFKDKDILHDDKEALDIGSKSPLRHPKQKGHHTHPELEQRIRNITIFLFILFIIALVISYDLNQSLLQWIQTNLTSVKGPSCSPFT